MNEDPPEKLIKKTQDKQLIAEYSQLTKWGYFIIDNRFEELQGKAQVKKLNEIQKGLGKIYRILKSKGSAHITVILEFQAKIENLQAKLAKTDQEFSEEFRFRIKQLADAMINLGQKLEKS